MATETHPLIVETRLPLRPGTDRAAELWDFLGRATVLVPTADGGAFAAGDHGVVWRIGPDGVVVPLVGDAAHPWADDRRTVDPGGVGAVGVVTGAVAMPDGSVLLAEPYRCRIRRLAPDGTLTTFASWDPRDPLLGTAQRAFPGPSALAVGEEGRLFAMLGHRRRILALSSHGGPGVVVSEDPPGGAFDVGPKDLRGWPSFAPLPGGGFLVADPSLGAVHILGGHGGDAVVRFQQGLDPLALRGWGSGTARVAVTPDGSWLAQFQDQLGLVSPAGRFGPIIGGDVRGAPWAVAPSGGVVRLVEDALLRYVVPTSQLAHELTGAHGFIVHEPKVNVSTLAGGRPGSQDGGLGNASFHHPAALASWGTGFVVLEAGAWRLRGVSNGRVETLADWTATPGVRIFDYADHGVAVDETGAIWVRGLSWWRLLGVDALGHLLDGPPDRADGSLVEEAGTYTVRPTQDESERYEAERRATRRDPNPVRERWTVPAETIAGLAGLLTSSDEPDRKGRRSWPLIATEPDGTAWVGRTAGTAARITHAAFATLPGLVHPIGRAVRVGSDLFVLARWEPRILRVDRDGAVSRYAGGMPGFRDGPALQAGFRDLVAIVADHDGGLLLVDEGNHAIRRISPDGLVSTVAGTGEVGFVDGPGAEAHFFEPSGLVLTPEGDLIVADKRNHALRLVRRAGSTATERQGHPCPAVLTAPNDLIGRRIEAVLVRSKGLLLECDGARASLELDDVNGIIELEGEGTERHEETSTLDPARVIGARVVSLDVDLEADRLPIVRALRFENGINLRVAADVGRVVFLPDRWNAATWRPRPLPGAASVAWQAFAGRTVVKAKPTPAGVELWLDDGRRATVTPLADPIPARSMWGEWQAPAAPQPWTWLTGRKIQMVGLRYETSGAGEPTEVVFYGEAEKEDAAFAAPSGIRLTVG